MTRPPATATSVSAVLSQAVTHLNAGRTAEAEAVLAPAREQFPGDADVWQISGAAARRAGRLDDAIDWMRKSLSLKNDQPAVWNNLGGALTSAGRHSEAIGALKRAIELAPGFAQASYNLGLAYLTAGQPHEAAGALRAALSLTPQSAPTAEALGLALARMGAHDEALVHFGKSIEIDPKRASAYLNSAASTAAKGLQQETLACLQTATHLAPSSPECAFALGNHYRNMGRLSDAIHWLRRAISLNPGYLLAHQVLNETVWQAGEGQDYLASYPPALSIRPSDVELRLEYARQLLRTLRPQEAAEEYLKVLKYAANSAAAHDGLATAYLGLQRLEDAIHCADRACELEPNDIRIQGRRGEVLIRAGRTGHAIDVFRRVLAIAPLDQENLARLSVAYRCAGDEAAHLAFSDPDALAVVSQLEPPEGFKDIDSFNRALADRLRSLHTAKQHPTDQTLRGGTQTLGSLFAQNDPLIQQLKAQLEHAIARVIGAMPDRSPHPFYQRKSTGFRFAGSWSVLLKTQGFHTNHIHPQGWISSAYYINLPDEVEGEGHEGWFKIGETNPDTLPLLPVERWVKPRPGSLVLFPSYMWHGTQAFQRSAERLTVAFDVVPD